MREERYIHSFLVEDPEGKRKICRPGIDGRIIFK
jgi:hypothetical protein